MPDPQELFDEVCSNLNRKSGEELFIVWRIVTAMLLEKIAEFEPTKFNGVANLLLTSLLKEIKKAVTFINPINKIDLNH